MTDAAAAFDFVCRASRPWEAKDTLKAKQRRAADRLQQFGLRFAASRVERAFKMRAGKRIRSAIQSAFERWQASVAEKRFAADRALLGQLEIMKEAIDASSDPDFYRAHFEIMCAALHADFVLGDPRGRKG